MKIKVEESFPGEFESTEPLELLDKWERAAHSCQCQVESMVRKSLGLPEESEIPGDARVDAITELVTRMSKAYESRMKTMVSDMVKAVEQGGDIEKSEEQPHAIYSDDDVQAMVMRAFGGFKPWRHLK